MLRPGARRRDGGRWHRCARLPGRRGRERARRSRAIGDLGRAEARRVIDAAGLVVAPGFVDPHTHAEGALLTDPQHAMGLRQGITTEFLGIDGMSYAPLSPAELPAVPPLAGRAARRAARGPRHVERRRLPAPLPPEGRRQHRVPGPASPRSGWRSSGSGTCRSAARSWIRRGGWCARASSRAPSASRPARSTTRGPWGDTAELIALCEPVARGRRRLHVRAAAGHCSSAPTAATASRRRSRSRGAAGVRLHFAHYRTAPETAGRIDAHAPHRAGEGRGPGRHLRHLPVPVGQHHRRELPARLGPGGRARRHPPAARGPGGPRRIAARDRARPSLPLAHLVCSYAGTDRTLEGMAWSTSPAAAAARLAGTLRASTLGER